jgi:hypothetical protein
MPKPDIIIAFGKLKKLIKKIKNPQQAVNLIKTGKRRSMIMEASVCQIYGTKFHGIFRTVFINYQACFPT